MASPAERVSPNPQFFSAFRVISCSLKTGHLVWAKTSEVKLEDDGKKISLTFAHDPQGIPSAHAPMLRGLNFPQPDPGRREGEYTSKSLTECKHHPKKEDECTEKRALVEQVYVQLELPAKDRKELAETNLDGLIAAVSHACREFFPNMDPERSLYELFIGGFKEGIENPFLPQVRRA